jgi:hypothetical protein
MSALGSFDGIILAAWVGTLLAVLIAGVVLLTRKGPQLKRTWFPRYVAGSLVLVVFATTGFIVSGRPSVWLYVQAAAFQAYLIFLGIQVTRWSTFCGGCGAMSLATTRRERSDTACRRCRAPLDPHGGTIPPRLTATRITAGLLTLALMVAGWVGIARLGSRRAAYYDRALAYCRQRLDESGSEFAAILRAEGDGARADRLLALIARGQLTGPMASSLAAQVESEMARGRTLRESYSRRRDYLRMMQDKYEAAARAPWRSVTPGPPEPPRTEPPQRLPTS